VFHVKQETPQGLRFLEASLAQERGRDLFRERPAPYADSRSFCSNDYLGLASLPAPPRAAGAGASRLVTGEREEHVELERAAAALVGQPAALAFASGYSANAGLIPALAGPGDVVVSDALNHASLIDGARLSRAQIVIAPHLAVDAVERALRAPRQGRAFVITESYFGMDADGPDLRALRAACDEHDAALIVDEAHALGVLGPDGRGRCAEAGIAPDALVGTFGKAFGAAGAFVAGCPALVTWLWNKARTFVFSTGMSPAVAAAARAGMATAQAEPFRRERVLALAAQLRAALECGGIQPRGFGHILPWVIGEPATALGLAALLRARDLNVRAIRPPTVPHGTARIRLTVTAAHDGTDIERAARVMRDAAREVGL
jgi:8-amino-7-oxononanoate synthase